jgi:ABC-2 type transport system ATP-binding protein
MAKGGGEKMAYAIEAQGLRKTFKHHEAVRGVDLTIRQGELFALLGPNGAGKSTTIHMLTTLVRPDGGTASVCGYDVVKQAAAVREHISVTGQYAALDESLTGWQNLLLFAGLHGYSGKEARGLAEELLDSFHLADASHRPVSTYSGGMRRRMDLAVGTLSQPEVMFLDEPTTGLDPQSRLELWQSVRQLVKQGTTVLLTTQYLEEADQLADRIGFITQGRVIAVDTPEQLKEANGGKKLTIRLSEGAKAESAKIRQLLSSKYGLPIQSDYEERVISVRLQEPALAHSIIGTLMEQSIGFEDFALHDPTLDDVYFALTANGEKEVVL